MRTWVIVCLVACGCGHEASPGPSGIAIEGGADAGRDGPVMPATEVDGGSLTVDLATSSACPCPKETYCDLPTNTCKVGCVELDGCGPGRVCDVASRTCKIGCVSCVDDGDPCTDEVCLAGECKHPPKAEGQSCGGYKA